LVYCLAMPGGNLPLPSRITGSERLLHLGLGYKPC
jgi:hypothetical protein